MSRSLRLAAAAVVLFGVFCASGIVGNSLALPPPVTDPTLDGVNAAFDQAVEEFQSGSIEDPADYQAAMDAWLAYFEGIPVQEGDTALADRIEEILAALRERVDHWKPVEPKPVEYVRICDVFGTGYFYIPGTDTCVPLSGGRSRRPNSPTPGFGPGLYVKGGLGGTIPFDDLVLEDFNQSAVLGSNRAILGEVGISWPTDFNIRFMTGFRSASLHTDVEALRNFLIPGPTTAAIGSADLLLLLAILGAEFDLWGQWMAEANVGVGRGWLDFDLTTAGGNASANDGAFAGQLGVGVQRFVTNCLSIGMTGYLTWLNGVSGQTGSGTHFQTGPFTSLALVAAATYRLGGFSSGSSCR